MKKIYFSIFCLLILFISANAGAAQFPVSKSAGNMIVYDPAGPKLDSICAYLLQQDIAAVTGIRPRIVTDLRQASGNIVIIGGVSSSLMGRLLPAGGATRKTLQGTWERYAVMVRTFPSGPVKKALLITGSDARGTAYGVFSVSEMLGVSPWYWWADVKPLMRPSVTLNIQGHVSHSPSVKYRGIFLNDEDWGLQPWAAKTFEPETGDIGPKTYAKIFELLLRLKANLIWPAMHPSTKAFYSIPGNGKVADDYRIVVGSSHAEPMLRNNVGEWNEKIMGRFNYLTNKEKVFAYWEERVRQSAANDAIFTLGMRGVHDSGMEGVKSASEAVPVLERIFEDQRGLLRKYRGNDVRRSPQAFTVYKEVLEIYEEGLKVPEDITLVWPDDNYGYIHRLNNSEEQKRSGGSGVYYHASYWGRPHDYLWLSSTNPALIREEMMKAYRNGSDRLWVVNVGDIKPIEYNMQLFLDMAYNAEPFNDPKQYHNHLRSFAANIFGPANGLSIARIWEEYYRLAFERRPEFMGWSRTEPNTKVSYSEYNASAYGDESQRRMAAYDDLLMKAKTLRKTVTMKDAFYQLVYYPVAGAAWMNRKFLFRDRAHLYAAQNRLSAFDYASESKLAYDSIKAETDYFNNELSSGKWKHMMSMSPRDLAVYQPPVIDEIKIDRSGGWDAVAEKRTGAQESDNRLIDFTGSAPTFIDIFLSDEKELNWSISSNVPWVHVSKAAGRLLPSGKKEERIWVSVDRAKIPEMKTASLKTVTITGGGKTIVFTATQSPGKLAEGFNSQSAAYPVLSVASSDFKTKTGLWTLLPGLTTSSDPAIEAVWTSNAGEKPLLKYDFDLIWEGSRVFSVYTLPSLPLNNQHDMRFAISVDDGPEEVISFKTVGRTEEWKQNVLRNSAVKSWASPVLKAGRHTLKIRPLDPGVVFQRITVSSEMVKQKAYSDIPATIKTLTNPKNETD